jgi:large subunit ribosomal protein L25
MAVTQVLKCKSREVKNTGYLRQLKRNEWVPAVVYGKGSENLTILLAKKELSKVFTHIGTRGIFSLEIEGKNQAITAQVKEVQKNRISGDITHVDFLTVKMNEKIHSMIRIHLVGEEALAEKGGALQQNVREIHVFCLPGDLPEVVTFDIADLEIGSKITVGDLSLPATLEVEDADTVIANILTAAKDETEVPKAEPAKTES